MKLIFIFFIIYASFLFAKPIDNTKNDYSIIFTEEELNYIKNRSPLKYSEINWKPLSIIENNRMNGIMGDYLKLIEKKSNLKFEFVPSNSWKEVLEKFTRKEIDIVPGIGDSDEEISLGLISEKYATYPMAIITRSNYTYVENLDFFKNSKIAVPKFYTSYNYILKNYPEIEIIPTIDIKEALLLVSTGKAEAFVDHIATSLFYISESHLENLKVSGITEKPFVHHYLIQNDDKILLSIINKTIKSISTKEQLEIYSRWIQTTKLEIEQNYEYIIFTAGIFLIIIMSLLFRQREIKKFISILSREKNEIKNEKQKFKAIFDSSIDGIALINYNDKSFVNVNKSFLEIVELSSNNLYNQFFDKLFFNDNEEKLNYILNQIKINGNEKIVERFKTKNNNFKTLELSISLISNSSKILIVLKDITERSTYQQNILAEKNKAIEDSSAKSQFLANVSHEIRTPLHGILSMAQLISNTNLTNKQARYINIVEQSTKNLVHIINDILDYSKIESGKVSLNKSEFDIYQLVDNVFNIVKESANNKNLELIVCYDDFISKLLYGDSTKISQILLNLLTNAIKFTEHGEVILQISRTEKNKFRFTVNDTGIGIPDKEREKLFIEFEQLDYSSTKIFKGMGLGLVISKKLANLMNGDIWNKWKKTKGSTFVFEVEIVELATQNKFNIFTNKKTLILDTEKYINPSLDLILTNFGIVSNNFRNEEDALKSLNGCEEEYDIVIVNSHYSEINQIGFFNRMSDLCSNCTKKINCKKQLPIVIILTNSFVVNDNLPLSNEIGLKYFITKPINPNELNFILSEVFGIEPIHALTSKSNINSLEGHILLVEDNKLNQQVVKALIADSNIKLDIAENGVEGYSKFIENSYYSDDKFNFDKDNRKKIKYDLILMDIQMPLMDGYECTQTIRKIDKEVPIIGFSANVFSSNFQKAHEVGMNAYMVKPIEINEFDKIISQYLGSKHITVQENNEEPNKLINNDINLFNFKTIDKNIGLKYFSNNGNFYIQILKEFYKSYKDLTFNTIDDETVKKVIHTLKGLSLNIGASKLNSLAINYENESTQEKLNEFYNEFLALIDELKAIEEEHMSNEV